MAFTCFISVDVAPIGRQDLKRVYARSVFSANMADIAYLVNTRSYPLEDTGSQQFKDLVNECRQRFVESGIGELEEKVQDPFWPPTKKKLTVACKYKTLFWLI